ncbi:MAG: RsmE family RNA methyltransferase [Candidatus Methylacidiphilales bacterium]
MHRFYCPDLDAGRLVDSENHHAQHVLRIRQGDLISLFDGVGREATAEVSRISKYETLFSIVSSHQSPPPDYSIHLWAAITKAKSWSLVLEKATELGVTSITPLLSERSIVRADEEDHSKVEKWKQEIIAACKQCGRNHLPVLNPLITVNSAVQSIPQDHLHVLASLQPGARSLRSTLLTSFKSAKTPSVTAAVGPEGDFSPVELGVFLSAGFVPVTLGSNVLRAETAALYLCAVLSHEIQLNN